MSSPKPSKTIAQVLEEFLADQKARLSPKTYSRYADIIHLFKSYLESYWPGHEQADYDRITKAGGTYCGSFGPEEITSGFSEFLGYFMPRKVLGGAETMKAAGTVTKKLARWLAEKGYAEDTEDAEDLAIEAARDLPASQKLLDLLDAYLDEHAPATWQRREEGHFWIKRVEPGKLWLEAMMSGEAEIGPIPVPDKVSRVARVGWDIGGAVGRTPQGWRLLGVWNVSP